jgi:starch-binding outer membrane protein SusE/F
MKKLHANIAFLLFALLMAVSCTKSENQVTIEDGTPPALTGSAASIELMAANETSEALRFNWTNPNYRFSNGNSSLDVTYVLEIDTVGANFSYAKKYKVNIARDLMKSFTVKELNTILSIDMGLDTARWINYEARITASIGGNAAKLASNKFPFRAKSYNPPPKVNPPASGKLFITGAATPGGWMGGGNPELATQRFTRVSPTRFELASLAINGDQSFLFVPVYGDWSAKFGYTGAGNANNTNGDTFRADGNDFKAPAVSGNYKIVVDFQTGTYTFTKL